MQHWKHGDKVRGTYCGVPYVGCLLADGSEFSTRNTPDYRNWIFVVTLDQPITVFGSQRDRLEIWENASSNTIETL